MALYKKCPNCGANLDPGEKCDCENERNGGYNVNNLIIRSAMLKTGIRAWQVAKNILKISEPTLYRKLRVELSEDEQQKIAALIEEYAKNGGQDHE